MQQTPDASSEIGDTSDGRGSRVMPEVARFGCGFSFAALFAVFFLIQLVASFSDASVAYEPVWLRTFPWGALVAAVLVGEGMRRAVLLARTRRRAAPPSILDSLLVIAAGVCTGWLLGMLVATLQMPLVRPDIGRATDAGGARGAVAGAVVAIASLAAIEFGRRRPRR